MHFIVLGAGAVGCYIGGRLAAAGWPVTLVGRPAVLAPMQRDGLMVSDLDGFKAQVSADALRCAQSLDDISWSADSVVLLCVKSRSTIAAAQELARACPAGVLLISVQNGVDNLARLAAHVPHLPALAAMVPYNVVLRGTHVHRATAGAMALERGPRTTAVAQIFRAAGLAISTPYDMQAVLWGKLLLNLNNPVNALSDLPLRQELLDRDYRTVLAALQAEALAAMGRAGIRPARLVSVPMRLLPCVLRLPTSVFVNVAQRLLAIDETARSSMWDDLEAGRETEVDEFCGAVVRLAQAQGMQAPLNQAMCALLQGPRLRLTGAQMRRALGI